MPVRGLTILVASGERVRMRAALSLATAQAALGGRVRLFAQEEAAPLLADGPDPDGESLRKRGLPALPELRAAAIEMGVRMVACQTGLAAAEFAADQLAPGVETGGLVGILADLDDDRLVIA